MIISLYEGVFVKFYVWDFDLVLMNVMLLCIIIVVIVVIVVVLFWNRVKLKLK